MKKLILLILAAVAMAFPAKNTVTLELCRYNFCYTQTYENVKKAEMLEDSFGNRFVRLYLANGSLLDVGGITVSIKK